MSDSSAFNSACDKIDEDFAILSDSARDRLKAMINDCMRDAYKRGHMQADENPKPKVVAPLVNMNGTTRVELQRKYQRAFEAVDKAIEAHAETTPHGRDYPLEGSYTLARKQHSMRAARLHSARGELERIVMDIAADQRVRA